MKSLLDLARKVCFGISVIFGLGAILLSLYRPDEPVLATAFTLMWSVMFGITMMLHFLWIVERE